MAAIEVTTHCSGICFQNGLDFLKGFSCAANGTLVLVHILAWCCRRECRCIDVEEDGYQYWTQGQNRFGVVLSFYARRLMLSHRMSGFDSWPWWIKTWILNRNLSFGGDRTLYYHSLHSTTPLCGYHTAGQNRPSEKYNVMRSLCWLT